MSRILRRPMFRGGPVSSYGTGIASGLADGGMPPKRGLVDGPGGYAGIPKHKKFMTGGDIVENVNRYTYFDPNALPGFSSVKRALPIVDVNAGQDGGQQLGDTDYLVEKGYISDVEGPVDETMSMEELIDMQIGEKGDVYQTGKSGLTKTVTGIDEKGNLITTTEDGKPREITSVEDLTEDEKIKYRINQMKADKGAKSMESTLPGVIKVETSPTIVNPNTAKVINEGEESTAISADDIKAQAALFDRLLNEDYEKDKKSARAQDLSYWALQFSKSTVGEGKGMKEAYGDTVDRILSTPSRTEKVEEGKKKTKQTATVMAINEALAEGKSDRELKKILGLADYKGDITLKNAIALATYKDSKNNFFDNYKENLKSGMGMGRAAIFTVEETFNKSPKILTAEDITKGVLVAHKENVGEYFIYPDGKITTVIPKGDGFVEDIVLSGGG